VCAVFHFKSEKNNLKVNHFNLNYSNSNNKIEKYILAQRWN